MTEPVRQCMMPTCPHIGRWHIPLCPAHRDEGIRLLRAAVDNHQRRAWQADKDAAARRDRGPLAHAADLLGGEG